MKIAATPAQLTNQLFAALSRTNPVAPADAATRDQSVQSHIDIGVDDVIPVTTTTVFNLPEHLVAKADPAMIAGDELHLAAVAESLEQQIAELSDQLDAQRKAPGGKGRAALDRDLEIHRLTADLRLLRRFGLDVCLGRMVSADSPEPTYVGRFGLTDSAGRRLLVDWRAPAAEPFFAATYANPMGLTSRRRYRWTRGRITDYWDEVFSPEGLEGDAALDDLSAFIASLGSSRSPQMRDVLSTIQADQDAIIRASSRGALVVEGGPGTGKTVVALHRAAYLLYSDPHLGGRRGGVLFVGPHRPYLAYIADVLPSLGEEGVQICTLSDLVAEGSAAAAETDPEVARLKSSADMVKAIEPAVRLYEEPPTKGLMVETDWADLWISAADWAEAFESPDPGTPHNEARDQVRDELVDILIDRFDEEGEDDAEVPLDLLRRSLRQNPELNSTLNNAWTLIEAADLVGDLWSVPAYLRRCAPWLTADEVQKLQRDGCPGLDGIRPATPGCSSAAARRPGGVTTPAPTRSRRRRRTGVHGSGRRRPDQGRRRRGGLGPGAAPTRPAGHACRRGRTAERRPGPARRPVRPHRRGRGSGADRRGVADAATPLPVAELHDRRRPRPGPARVHRDLAGTAGAGRVRSDQPRLPEHQLPDAGGGHGGSRAGHPGRVPGRQRADLHPRQWSPRCPRTDIRAGLDPGCLARHARRRHCLRHWRPHVQGDVARTGR